MRWNTRAAATVRRRDPAHRMKRKFENDGSPVSTIVEGVKRAMAGEYSREFSAKAFDGQSRLIELGFRQGSPAGHGSGRPHLGRLSRHRRARLTTGSTRD